MIGGRFGEIGELIFEIDLIALDGESFSIDVLLDTGFTTGLLALDTQDAESLGWVLIERNRTMQTARGIDFFDVYEGRIVLDRQEYVISVGCEFWGENVDAGVEMEMRSRLGKIIKPE